MRTPSASIVGKNGSRARLLRVPPCDPLVQTLDGHVVELGAVASVARTAPRSLESTSLNQARSRWPRLKHPCKAICIVTGTHETTVSCETTMVLANRRSSFCSEHPV